MSKKSLMKVYGHGFYIDFPCIHILSILQLIRLHRENGREFAMTSRFFGSQQNVLSCPDVCLLICLSKSCHFIL